MNHFLRVKNPFLALLLAAGLGSMHADRLQAQTVTHVAGGGYHTLFTKSDGSLWSMGYNYYGQLGIGFAPIQTNVPQQILSSGVGVVAAGDYHSLFQKGGTLWAMGRNDLGQLGDGTTNNHYFPEQVFASPARYTVAPIACGSSSSYFQDYAVLSGGGAFWAMGWNAFGQLGDGTINSTNRPEEILVAIAGHPVVVVAGGGYHCLYTAPNGSLWGMGYNGNGQLGTGDNTNRHSPVEIVAGNVTAVAAGLSHSLFTKSDGSLWAMGVNNYGQLGDNTTVERNTPEQVQFNGVIAVAAGSFHSLFIKSDGSLWGMGLNGAGQLGTGDNTDRHLPALIVASNVVAVAAGAYHSLFIKSDGSLWGMGFNGDGQLGDGTTSTSSNIPEQIVAPPPPTITSITLSGANVVVSWPTNQGGFTLQATTSLAPPTVWSTVSAGVIVSNQYVVTNPISGPQMFYRLGE
jgi:alpha-tubulin suppressor-like RCC1 family protein